MENNKIMKTFPLQSFKWNFSLFLISFWFHQKKKNTKFKWDFFFIRNNLKNILWTSFILQNQSQLKWKKKKAIKNYICLDLFEAWGLSEREDMGERDRDRKTKKWKKVYFYNLINQLNSQSCVSMCCHVNCVSIL